MSHLRLLLVTGSTRSASTNTAALRAAVELLTPDVDAVLHDGLAELPAFDPDRDRDPLPAPVARLRDEIGRAGGVVFCTPEYAGTLPGSLKNLLDWTVGGGELYGKPAAWINVAAPGRGTGADVDTPHGARLRRRRSAPVERRAGQRPARRARRRAARSWRSPCGASCAKSSPRSSPRSRRGGTDDAVHALGMLGPWT